MTTAVAEKPRGAAEVRGIQERSKNDPVWFCRKVLGFEPWSKQREILNALRDHNRVAVRSAHGVGKTAIAARAVLWFMATHGPGSCRVVTTAPTWEGVRNLLWAEINTAARSTRRIPQLGNERVNFGQVNTTDLRIAPNWFAIGLSTDVPERFQGHHADNLLLVVDEASGVDEAIYDAARGFLTGANAKVLLIGNPTRTVGTFRRCFEPDSGWRQIHISAMDSPNLTGEQVDPRAARALPTAEWVEEMRRDYGDDSATYLVRVMGEFAAAEGRPALYGLQHCKPVEPLRVGRLTGAAFRGAEDPIRFVADPRGRLKIWRAPAADERFVVFADPAGVPKEKVYDERDPRDADDYSCAQVVSLDSGEPVAVLHGRWPGFEFAHELARLGYVYNTALVAVEATGGYGNATVEELRTRLAYPNLYRQEPVAHKDKQPGVLLGWATTVSTRPLMVEQVQRMVLEHPEMIRDAELLGELRTFVHDSVGKAGAAPGCHDDRVMALGGALAVRMRADRVVRLGPARKPRRVEGAGVRASRPKVAA